MSVLSSDDVRVVRLGEREIVVLGTAHVSRESVDLVRSAVSELRPDVVCVELDAKRFEALARPDRFEGLDLREVIRTRQLATLGLNLALASYQRSLGVALGVKPGAELLEAARCAEAEGIPVALCDRDVRITLRRAWRALSLWKRMLLVSTFTAAIFERAELSEEDLRELRRTDVLSRLLNELGAAFPGLKTVLIDERDLYLAERIRETPGRRVLAVVGAGHVEGLVRTLESGARVDLAALSTTPASSRLTHLLGWGLPALVVLSLVAIGLRDGGAVAGENVAFFALATGLPSAAGTLLALGHPATVLSALLLAPLTALSPLIGIGHVTALVQSWMRPPFVRELSSALEDLGSAKGLWGNRLLRVLLVFTLSTLGGMIGTWVGGARLLSSLMGGR
jgi:pheromone shutdown-related protein TraB